MIVGGVFLMTAGLLASNHMRTFREVACASSNLRTYVDEKIDLVGGSPNLVTVYLIYDSTVAT